MTAWFLAAALLVAPSPTPEYRPPVAAPVVSPFDVSSGPYGPGNRGLDYAVAPGTAAGAIGDGLVVFAGSVAGGLWVTVAHPDGLRSSYGPLAAASVRAGVKVTRGDPVGLTGPRLHLGVRSGARYLDPATLFGRRRARLVPVPRRLARSTAATATLSPRHGQVGRARGARLADSESQPRD